MSWLFFLIALFTIIEVWVGYKRGLLRTVYSTFGWIFMTILVGRLSSPATKWVMNSTGVADRLAQNSEIAVRAIVLVVLLILAMIIFSVVSSAIGIIDYIPVVGGINSLAGGAVGFVKAMLLMMLFFALVSIAGETTEGQFFIRSISESSILLSLYKKNLLLNLILLLL